MGEQTCRGGQIGAVVRGGDVHHFLLGHFLCLLVVVLHEQYDPLENLYHSNLVPFLR